MGGSIKIWNELWSPEHFCCAYGPADCALLNIQAIYLFGFDAAASRTRFREVSNRIDRPALFFVEQGQAVPLVHVKFARSPSFRYRFHHVRPRMSLHSRCSFTSYCDFARLPIAFLYFYSISISGFCSSRRRDVPHPAIHASAFPFSPGTNK